MCKTFYGSVMTDLKAIRRRIGETQEQFALRFGVHQSTIHDWETKGIPRAGAAAALVERVLAELPVSENNAAAGAFAASEGIPQT